MSMLKEANVGIQLSHRDVPLIFGDIVISELKILNYLLFVKGKQIYTNYITYCLLLIAMLSSSSTLVFLFNSNTLFSGRFFQSWAVNLLYAWVLTLLIVSTTSNKSYTRTVLEKNPEFYLERKTINQNFLTLCAGCLLLAIIDSLIIYFTSSVVLRTALSTTGYVFESNALGLHVTISLLVKSAYKIYMFNIRLGNKFWIVNFLFLTSTLIWLALTDKYDTGGIDSIPVRELFSSPIAYAAFLSSVGVTGFLVHVVFHWMNRTLIYPFFYQSLGQLKAGNLAFFSGLRGQNAPNSPNPSHFKPKETR
jgi:hypothetical protein